MSFTPNDSAIKTDAALEAKLKSASFEEIKSIMANAAIQQGLVVPDAYDPSVLLPVDQPEVPTPKKFAATVTLPTGEKKLFQADSELELEKAQTVFFRELMLPNKPSDTVQPIAQPRNDRGQYVSADDAAARAELELKFKRGEIPASEYLAQSGAIDTYLADKGIDITHLQQVANAHASSQWQNAVNEFKARHPDYIADNSTLQEFQRTLVAMNLVDSPSVDSIEKAYADIVRRDANPAAKAQRELHSRFANATSFSEIQEAAASSLFGRR